MCDIFNRIGIVHFNELAYYLDCQLSIVNHGRGFVEIKIYRKRKLLTLLDHIVLSPLHFFSFFFFRDPCCSSSYIFVLYFSLFVIFVSCFVCSTLHVFLNYSFWILIGGGKQSIRRKPPTFGKSLIVKIVLLTCQSLFLPYNWRILMKFY